MKKIVKILIIFIICVFISSVAVLATEGTYKYLYEPETRVSEVKRLYSELYEEDIQIYKGDSLVSDNEYVATGMKLRRNSITQTVILVGDVNKDGKISSIDLSLISNHIVNNIKLTGDALKAADINSDGNMTTTDMSAMKMLLVELEFKRGESLIPTIKGDIVIETSTMDAIRELEVSVKWPADEVVAELTKEISIDGGKTFVPYSGPVTVTENTTIIARLSDENGNVIKTERITINNIDNIAPNTFEITATPTSTKITVNAETTDTALDANGKVITTGIAGVEKYLYKLNNGEWQENNVFSGLTPETEYRVVAKAIDYAGNETEANEIVVTTKGIPKASEHVTFTYEPSELTKQGVLVTFVSKDEAETAGFLFEYQIGGTDGQWKLGNSYIAEVNCKIYVRIVNELGEASEEGYAVGEVTNIDKLAPLEFTPKILVKEGTTLTIQANGENEAGVQDAPEDEYNACSGMGEYLYMITSQDGQTIYSKHSNTEYKGIVYGEVEGNVIWTSVPEPTYTFEVEEGKEYTIMVYAYDKVGNERRSTVIGTTDNPVREEGDLGIGEINNGEANVTVNGGAASAINPLVPVGFKAVNTPDASWEGVTPTGWNDGLVIEDENGNQFVWVPVQVMEGQTAVQAIDKMMYDSRNSSFKNETSLYDQGYYVITGDEIPDSIKSEEGSTVQGKYQYRAEIVEEVESNQGFYVARYEAGNANGNLASISGVMPMGAVTYNQAKGYAEGMYNTPYVTSSLITGTQWDLMANWIGQKIGWESLNNLGTGANAKGNVYGAEFTFTGKYKEGPYFPGELIGEVVEGTDVQKKAGDRMLLATGIVEKFKISNIYDLYGNVWEYTTEIGEIYLINHQSGMISQNAFETGNYARGADYYWETQGAEGVETTGWGSGIYYRGIVRHGDARNEGGFRVVLFLKESKAAVDEISTHNATIDGGAARFNNPVIPAGFKPVNTSNANWGDGKTPAVDWNNGLVIEDTNGNQFVWVPVDKTDVTYETWTEGKGAGYSYQDMGSSDTPSGWDEDSQITRYGGFYIARYEASITTEKVTDEETDQTTDKKVAQSKSETEVATNINYNEAKELAEGIKTAENVQIGLVTGKQWDTTMKWLSKTLGEEAILEDSSSIGNYSGTINATGAYGTNNIFDLAGNAWEWTSENYDGKKVYRGGVATATGETSISYRGAYEQDLFDEGTSFRMALFVTGEVSGISPLPVEDTEKLDGDFANGSSGTWELSTSSKKNNEIKITSYPAGWTYLDVTLTISTITGEGEVEYKIGTNGTWTKGNSVTLTENNTVFARLVGSEQMLEFPVTKIDREKPTISDVKTQVNGNSVTISGKVTDNTGLLDDAIVHVWLDDYRYFAKVKNGEFEIVTNEPPGNHTYKLSISCWDYAENGGYYESTVTTGDTKAPNAFEPVITVQGNKIIIEANTADSGTGIANYQYYIDSTLVYTGGNKHTIENLELGKTYSILVAAVDANGNRSVAGPYSAITESETLKAGVYIKTKLQKITGPFVNSEELNKISEKEVTVQLKDGTKTENKVLLEFYDEYSGKKIIISTKELTEHTTIISGSGTFDDPYISDGVISVNITSVEV